MDINYSDYGFGPAPKRRRKGQSTIEQNVAEMESEIASIAKLWEKRGKKAHKEYKKMKKSYKKVRKDYAKAKAEGRDPITLTKHYAGRARQLVHPKHSMYYIPKKGMASKLKGLFKKKKKGIYK